MAAAIGAQAKIPYPGDGYPIDRFLGELLDGFDVHEHVKQLINNGSPPNEMHDALVRLAGSSGEARIVTTNFDDHLRGAARIRGLIFEDTYFGPALPVGRDFSGLVHLHGSVCRPSKELIVTDHDFGHAYLTDAWATRFLRDLFDRFVVLFVGFSHNDPLIDYLGMGLPSSSRSRFILIDSPHNPKWKRVGVTPVSYPKSADHAGAVRAIAEWAKLTEMGRLDHQARVQEIVKGGPPKSPVDIDYLSRQLRTSSGAGAFAEVATDASWLRWLEDQEPFAVNFQSSDASPYEEDFGLASRILGAWFRDRFVAEPANQVAAMNLILRTGQQLSQAMWDAAPWAVRELADSDIAAAKRWTVLLSSSIHRHTMTPSFESYLSTYGPGTLAPLELTLRQALRPQLRLRPDYWSLVTEAGGDKDGMPSADLAWPVHEQVATSYLTELRRSLPSSSWHLCSLLENAAISAYELLDAWSQRSNSTFDPLSFGRSAIEPHPQDEYREVVDVLIDGLRDLGDEIAKTDFGLIDRWWNIGYPIFRRLAVYFVGCSSQMSASERIEWLLRRDLLFNFDAKHEVYSILRESLPMATVAAKALVLRAVLVGPQPSDEIDDRHFKYMQYNLLVWIVEADGDWAEAKAALADLQAENPQFSPREHPDLDHWHQIGPIRASAPTTTAELVHMVHEDGAEKAMAWLVNLDVSDDFFDGPTSDDLIGLLRSVAETDPKAGLEIWDCATVEGHPQARKMREMLTYGWAQASLEGLLPLIVDKVERLTDDPSSAYAVSNLLFWQMSGRADQVTDGADGLRRLARATWDNLHTSFAHDANYDPTMLALNSWPGQLAAYWIMEIGRRWRTQPDSWSGLTTEESEELARLIQYEGAAGDAARPAIAGEVYFLFGADQEFTIQNVFPLFGRVDRLREAWEPYLRHHRWDNHFLAEGFLEKILGTIGDPDHPKVRDFVGNFTALIAEIVMYSDIPSETRTEILDSLVIKSPEQLLDLIEYLSHLLEREKSPDTAGHWDGWLKAYVSRRINGEPRRAPPAELATWADLTPYFGDRVPEAVATFADQPVAFRDRFFWHPHEETIAAHAEALARFLIYRLKCSTSIDVGVAYVVRDAANSIVDKLDRALAQNLSTAAAEKGIRLT